jgi:gliding motility-associated-like protein
MNRSITLLFLLFLIAFSAKAQIQVNDATVAPYTPENLISNYFLGEGVQVLSVKYEGATEAVGFFNNAQSRIGINKGIVLTNGRVSTTGSGLGTRYGIDAVGNETANNDNKNNPKDVDINQIINPTGGANLASHNLAKYTITFIPSADTLRFRYVFASEEYPTYVCDAYNDIFGFFISGPGINGPYENNGQNIALVPGTQQPVTINNVNLGNNSKINCPPKNPQFYNDNYKSNTEPVYNAFLDVMTAQAVVQPCKVYTIKLIIADIGDPNYDSGVFLEAKSFGTGSVQVDRITQASDNNIIEGCSPGSITFRLPKKADKDTPLKCNLIGTAKNGIDYKLISSNLFVPKGDSILKVDIDAISDLLKEGIETLGFDIQRDVCNRDTFWFNIKDNDFPTTPRKTINDTTICKGQEIKFDATANVVLPPNPTFKNSDSTTINTVLSGSTTKPTTLSILVSNVTPLQFTPDMIESVCLNIRHPWIDDNDIYLVAPNGQFIALSTDNGGSGDNMYNTCFSPSATKSITTGTPPFSDYYLPEDNFSDLINGNNNPVNGYWNLIIIDDQGGINGKILDWSITFKSNYSINYQWNTNQNISCSTCPTPIVKPNSNFEYQVQIKDVYGCVLRDTAKVIVKDTLEAPQIVCGVSTHNNLEFTWLKVTDATSYEISINGGNWFDVGTTLSYNFIGLSPSTNMKVDIRAKGLCAAKTSTQTCSTLPCTTVTPKVTILNDISCKGKNDGKVTLNVVSGGTPPYTYKMGSQTNMSGLFDKLSAGIYTVSISDANTCNALVDFQITEPSQITLNVVADSVTCVGAADAIALAEVKGGTTPYTYKWSNGSNTDLAEQLKKGTYGITISDVNGCSLVDSIKIFEPLAINLKIQKTDPTCSNYSDGTARAFVQSGGTAPFQYLWRTNLGLQTTSKVIGLSTGFQDLTVTDSRGCEIETSVFISAPKNLDLKVTTKDPLCFGEKTGMITTNLSGGTTPYSYLWNNGSTIESLDKLKAGTYILTITDKNNCSLIDTFYLRGFDSIAIRKIQINPTKCYGDSNGSITVSSSGGGGAFLYNWSNGNKSNFVNNLKAGTYYLTVSDGNNCSQIDSVKVTQPDTILIAETIMNTGCITPNSGSITLNISGGNGGYTYQWEGTNNFTSTNKDVVNLVVGNYQVTVTDINSCTNTKSFTVEKPANFNINATLTDVKCKGDSTGIIELNVSGGNAPYTYEWSNGKTTNKITNLLSGNYDVTITDATACSSIKSYEIKEPLIALSLQISGTDSLCFQAQNGELLASAAGGTSPYIYNWKSGQNTNKISNLPKGNYILTITDANQCSAIAQRQIDEFGKIEMKIEETVANCHNSKDAILKVSEIAYNQSITTTNIFQFRWSNGSNDISADQLTPGETYTVTATNSRGCTATTSFTTTKPSAPIIELIDIKQPSCGLGNDGAININGKGGVTPYTFNWSNSATGSNIIGLSSGNFDVTMSDNKGCTANASFNLKKPNTFTYSTQTTKEKCAGTGTGTSQIKVTGGTPPFSFEWDNAATTAAISNLNSGTYTFTITDAAGCTQAGNVKIDSVPNLIIAYTTKPIRCGGQNDGAFTISPKGGTPPYQYSVDNKPFNGQNKIIGLRANVYEVIVKDANNCLANISIPINEPLPIIIDLGKDTSVKFGEQYRIPTEIENVIGQPTFSWFPDEPSIISCTFCKNPLVSPKTSTLYTLTIKDSLGCVSAASVNISVIINTNIFVPTGFSPNADKENDLLLVHGEKDAMVLSFDVFDRWGERLFFAENFPVNDPNTGWNGYYKNEAVPSGVYPWLIKVKFKDGSIKQFKGSTTLIR